MCAKKRFEIKTEETGAAYPRPQFRREGWQSLNGDWEFAIDREAKHRSPNEVVFNRTIRVPFAPETPASGIGDQSFYSACWYRRTISCERSGDERVFLHFEAVDELCDLWVNGRWMGQREGGYVRHTWDVTDALGEGGEAEVVVRAFDDPHDLHKPRGKQDWLEKPHAIWYPRTTGIWQTVWLEKAPAGRIETLNWDSAPDRCEVGLEAVLALAGSARPSRLRVRLRLGETVLVDDAIEVRGDRVSRAFRLAGSGGEQGRPDLHWTPERPNLIDAEIQLLDGDGRILDRVFSYTAMRLVEIRDGRFELNGSPCYMRLALDQGYWPESGMTAPSDDALAEDIRLAKRMGFNGVRKHQKIEAERFLYWADTLGFLVWEELPSAYEFSTRSVNKLTNLWRAAIERDRNHPSIVVWVPFNESWAVPGLARNARHRHAVEALHHLTKALDDSRPADGNDGWEIGPTDLIGIHDYDGNPETLRARLDPAGRGWQATLEAIEPSGRRLLLDGRYKGQPVLLTEFGGIKLATGAGWGYSTAATPEDMTARYARLLRAVRSVPGLTGFCYTQLTDTYQETNGLLTMEREPKMSIESIRLATSGPATEEERAREEEICRQRVQAATEWKAGDGNGEAAKIEQSASRFDAAETKRSGRR